MGPAAVFAAGEPLRVEPRRMTVPVIFHHGRDRRLNFPQAGKLAGWKNAAVFKPHQRKHDGHIVIGGHKEPPPYQEKWWQFGEPGREMRPALETMSRYIATVETSKHRVFQFLDTRKLPDNMLVAIASDNAFDLGVLSSRPHVIWALRAGGRQGVGNDPRYSKSRCSDPFPFPNATMTLRMKIAELADELDSTRKLALVENPDLILTGLYNMLDASRSGEALSTADRELHKRGRIRILKDLHEQIDISIMRAYARLLVVRSSADSDRRCCIHLHQYYEQFVQLSTEPLMRGLIMALRVGVALGWMPTGALIEDWVADQWGHAGLCA